MTPKEKAKKMFYEFYFSIGDNMIPFDVKRLHLDAKQCALISVDELIKEHTWKSPISWNKERLKYWQQVKIEIQAL